VTSKDTACVQHNRTHSHQPSAARFCNIFARPRAPSAKTHSFEAPPCLKAQTLSEDAELNETLARLYNEVLCGNTTTQSDIDSYIYAELVLRDKERGRRLRACCGAHKLSELLRSQARYTISCDTLPDLGNIIRNIVFSSGNCPPEQHPSTFTPLVCAVYDALPNIKRTKQIKQKAAVVLDHIVTDSQHISAMISVMLGTLLALYPNNVKVPGFRLRCDIVATLRKVQCMCVREKFNFIQQAQHIIKACFLEYVPWFIQTYMPVEASIMARADTTPVFLHAYPNVCEMFRQEMIFLNDFDVIAVNKMAMQAIERCSRLCKFKMQRHITNKNTTIMNFKNFSKEDLQAALSLLPINTHRRLTAKLKGRIVLSAECFSEVQTFYANTPTSEVCPPPVFGCPFAFHLT